MEVIVCYGYGSRALTRRTDKYVVVAAHEHAYVFGLKFIDSDLDFEVM